MTNITLTVTGASARAVVNGPLTSGMVGIPITIEYNDTWDGLIKNLICKSEPKSCSLVNTTRTIVNIGTTATVAHEVMRADRVLYLGVEGKNADGETVISTAWARCGEISLGATADADPSADPTLQIWAQVQAELEQVKKQAVTEAQVSTIISDYLGEYLPAQNTALSEQQINALDGMFKVCAFTKADVSAEYAAFQAAFGISDSGGGSGEDGGETEKTLATISATYNGGDVAVGTAVTDLTGVVVTAIYSDGSTETVTGYTLSGTIAEGENIITVSYEGKSATFTVLGISAEAGVSNEITWTDGVPYEYTEEDGVYIKNSDGTAVTNTAYDATPYLYCDGASTLRFTVLTASSLINSGTGGTTMNAFYDSEKNYISGFDLAGMNNQEVGSYSEVSVPENAAYFRASGKEGVFGKLANGLAGIYVSITPYN